MTHVSTAPSVPAASSDDDRSAGWEPAASPAAVAEALIGLYERRGDHPHDDLVSATEHALQCGAHAMVSASSLEAIVGAFLHDVGHLLDLGPASRRTGRHDGEHAEAGARFLEPWFPAAVVEPIRLHVEARRYLCAIDADYRLAMSESAVEGLRHQGGPMRPEECAAFEDEPFADAAIALRRWDDRAHEPHAPVPTLDSFRSLVEAAML